MSGWVAGSCTVVAVPLLIALVIADVALSRLDVRAEALADTSQHVAQLSTSLRDTLRNLERNALQYQALQDPELRKIVSGRMTDADRLLDLLLLQSPPGALRDEILQILTGLKEIEFSWRQGSADTGSVADRIHTLTTQASLVIDNARVEVDEQINRLRYETRQARRLIALTALILIPLAFTLVLGFSRAVALPLHEMGRSIAALGHGRYDRPIAIRSPHEMQRLGIKLDWLRLRLALFDADKDRFLRHVSHELKTPLASLSEGISLLKDGSLGRLTAKQSEVTQILAESARELSNLIENLLTYAEWRRGRRQMEREWFNTVDLVEEVIKAHRLPMEARRLSVELNIGASRLFGLRPQLRASLDNLLTNAVKHSPEGGLIQICAQAQDESCELSVRDHGHGVADEEKQRIFEPFVRGAEAEERGIRGAGIGLSIVEETLHAHDGVALVEDAWPGARFKLIWPCPPERQ